MAKFDRAANLPEIFRKNKLSILPISRGSYFIGCFDNYCQMKASNVRTVKKMPLTRDLQSLNIENITSEALALNLAVAEGIVDDFLKDENLLATVCGRMSSGCFDFQVDNTQYDAVCNIHVENAQIEIDAAYEGAGSLAIFEAKINISDDNDFLIRQLYYPFRTWRDRVTKPVRPVFLIYANGIYTLREYTFRDPLNYNSIEIVRDEKYSLEDTDIEIHEIEEMLKKSSVCPEPAGTKFPQANSFDRIINLCEILKDRNLNRDDITEEYDFAGRQSNYYVDAAIYLGLAQEREEETRKIYQLTDAGRKIMNMRYKPRQLALCACIFSRAVFNALVRQYFQTGKNPAEQDIIHAIQAVNTDLGASTLRRRASTVAAWLRWVARLAQIR